MSVMQSCLRIMLGSVFFKRRTATCSGFSICVDKPTSLQAYKPTSLQAYKPAGICVDVIQSAGLRCLGRLHTSKAVPIGDVLNGCAEMRQWWAGNQGWAIDHASQPRR